MSSPAPLRIGSVPYLNARPLVWKLAELLPGCALEERAPSVLARKLAAGELDLALVSSIEALRHPEYGVAPGLSISAWDEMWSIQLFHRKPLPDLRRVALDPDSETSNALLRLVLKPGLSPAAQFIMPARGPGTGGGGLGAGHESRATSHEPRATSQKPRATRCEPPATREVDAFLLIGDPALVFDEPGWQALDLARAWQRMTGKPFVFALWLARPGVEWRSLAPKLQQACRAGRAQAARIAELEAPRRGLSPARAREYLTRIVRYGLGPAERGGLEEFRHRLAQAGMLDA